MKRIKYRHKGFLFSIKEFRAFMRLEACFYIACIGVSGFLLFNPMSFTVLPLFLAMFFLTGSTYGYNHITDREEDRINDNRLNIFVTNGKGVPAIVCMFAASVFFSLFLPLLPLLIFALIILLSFAYSKMRVKKLFLVKNLYTGIGMELDFLAGAAVGGFSPIILTCFPIGFFFGFMINLLGDIRGYEGDLAAGAKTLPIFMGVGPSMKLAQSLFLGFSVYTLILRFHSLYPLAAFAFLISFFLAFEKHKLARAGILSSFVVFSAFLIAIKAMEGGV